MKLTEYAHWAHIDLGWVEKRLYRERATSTPAADQAFAASGLQDWLPDNTQALVDLINTPRNKRASALKHFASASERRRILLGMAYVLRRSAVLLDFAEEAGFELEYVPPKAYLVGTIVEMLARVDRVSPTIPWPVSEVLREQADRR